MDPLDKEFMGHIKEGSLQTLKVNDLKEFLTVKNLPNKGNKNYMIQLVEEYFETNFNIS